MIAADDDRRLHFAVPHHLIEGESEAMTLAEANPADARRQALEGDALLCHVEPVVEMGIVGNQLLTARAGRVDIVRIAGERCPSERSDATAEERADIGRHETRKIKRMRKSHVE